MLQMQNKLEDKSSDPSSCVSWLLIYSFDVFHLKSLHFVAVFCGTLFACFTRCNLPLECLINSQTTQARLATSKTLQPQVDLIDIAAPPSVSCSSVGTSERES
jgi:hypothetical protein